MSEEEQDDSLFSSASFCTVLLKWLAMFLFMLKGQQRKSCGTEEAVSEETEKQDMCSKYMCSKYRQMEAD